jgi:response regulator NasT
MGHRIIASVKSGLEAVDQVRELSPDLVFMDIHMEGIDGLEASRRILSNRAVPIIIITGRSDEDVVEEADAIGVSGYLVKPIKDKDLAPAVRLACSRYHQLKELEREIGDLKGILATRKLVEQAKGILMEKEGITEAEAFRRIQQQSRNQNIPMGKLAEAIITAGKVMGSRGTPPTGAAGSFK